jgi:hypothetical protein
MNIRGREEWVAEAAGEEKNGTRMNADWTDARGSEEVKISGAIFAFLIRENPLNPHSSASHFRSFRDG